MQADIARCAEAGFDLHMMKPVIPIFFQELGELLMISKGVAARSPESLLRRLAPHLWI